MTAATTAARVPASPPGAVKTLIPTRSFGDTRLRHASATAVLPVRLVRPRCTIWRTFSGLATNAWVASASCTITTREGAADAAWSLDLDCPSAAGPAQNQAATASTRPQPASRCAKTCAFLDTSEDGCYHQPRC